jgi:phage antirepressor YoqD-like protein
MNKFLSSISSGGVTKEEVLQIIEETSVTYNDDSSVSINNSANASIYTLPTVGGVAGNSVVVGADGKHLIFANTGGGGGGVQNPMSVDLDAGAFNINNVESLTSNYIDTDNITPKTGSSILVSGDLNLNSNGLTRVDKITCLTTATPSVDLKLDLIPSSQGTANQVLSRSPLFDPANSSTYKLVWQTIAGGGGGVQNPMSVDLDGGNFSINNVESITSNYIDTDNITPKTGSSILVNGDLNLNSNGLTRVDTLYCTAANVARMSLSDWSQDGMPKMVTSTNLVPSGHQPCCQPCYQPCCQVGVLATFPVLRTCFIPLATGTNWAFK